MRRQRYSPSGRLNPLPKSDREIPWSPLSDAGIILDNAPMHRKRNRRLSDDQLLAKAEQYERDMVNQALIQLVAEECRKRGLC